MKESSERSFSTALEESKFIDVVKAGSSGNTAHRLIMGVTWMSVEID